MFKILSVVVGLIAIRLAISYAQAIAVELREKPTSKSPVVGISLSANHATAAVRWPDGTFENLGRVEASKAYVKMMRRLSLPSSMHLTEPYGSMEDLWNDAPRRAWRSARKKLGLPASADVAVLAKMLKATARMAESELGSPVSAIQSFPALLALYQEDIKDAAEYAGLRMLTTDSGLQLHELIAAYAGHGMGLSESGSECQTSSGFPGCHTVIVEYTEGAILLDGRPLDRAHDIANYDEDDIRTSFDLGSRSSATEEQVRDFVLQYLRKVYIGYTKRPWVFPEEITVIMTGSRDSVGRVEIRMAIADAFSLFGTRARMLYSDPEYVAARGAAEIAWRTLVEADKKKENTEL